ncbi:MAG TPA: hypothetical protein VML55_00815 [Planctomycetaceae bacterium]|nr:hypothetical protein [Planctomycetaceae bacterium]
MARSATTDRANDSGPPIRSPRCPAASTLSGAARLAVLAVVVWAACNAFSSRAQASCGDWLAGARGWHEHDSAIDSFTAELHDARPGASRLPDLRDAGGEDTQAPGAPCRGLWCSKRSPAPAPPTTPPSVPAEHWAWHAVPPDFPERGAALRPASPPCGRPAHLGPDVFRPPRRQV